MTDLNMLLSCFGEKMSEAEAIEWSGVELEKGQRIDFLVGGRRSNQPIDDDDRCMQ